MDIGGFTITGFDIGAFMTGIGALIKVTHSDHKAEGSRKNMDERVAVLETIQQHNSKRLDDGDRRFLIIEGKMDDTRKDVADIKADVKYIRGLLEGGEKKK